jgi:Fe-S-cluster containining protein
VLSDLVQITRLPKRDFYAFVREVDASRQGKILDPQLPLEKLSKRLSASVVTDSALPIPDCVKCGACCVFPLIVPVSATDHTGSEAYWDLTLDDSSASPVIDRVLRRNPDDGRCSQLKGTVGGDISCVIYEDRPQNCRNFEAGSDLCHEYRRMYGIEQRLTDEELEIALSKLQDSVKGRIAFVRTLIHSVLMPPPDGDAEKDSGALVLVRIEALLDDDRETIHELHVYDPLDEKWFDGEFLSLTLQEAKALIESRQDKKV